MADSRLCLMQKMKIKQRSKNIYFKNLNQSHLRLAENKNFKIDQETIESIY